MKRFLSGLISKIMIYIEDRRMYKLLKVEGSFGDFYRNGGDKILLLESLDLSEVDTVWDVGGYHGKWSADIMVRYGCKIELFEPIPEFMDKCSKLFERNSRVQLHEAALGGSEGKLKLSIKGEGSSAHCNDLGKLQFEVAIIDVSKILQEQINNSKILDISGAIGCMNLNIEGGEYEVLERLIETGDIHRFRSLLIQFHPQPEGYEQRYKDITRKLTKTHQCVWQYPMVWERWNLLE